MKISIKNIAFYASLILLTSCNGDRFSQVLEIDLPEETPVLAVTSRTRAGEFGVTAYVTHTLGALEDLNFSDLPEATVRLLENGTEISQLEYDEPGRVHFAGLPAPIKDEPGTIYRLEVSANGYEDVFAEQVMPTKVPILSASYSAKSAIDFEGEEVDELSVVFKDPEDEANFYSFRLFVVEEYTNGVDTFNSSRNQYLDSIDPLFENGSEGYFMINDRSFSGGQYTATFFFYPLSPFEDPSIELVSRKIKIQLVNLTKDRYLYLKTLLAYRDNKDNPFSEPVTVHHNFENGTGTFTLESSSEFELDLEE